MPSDSLKSGIYPVPSRQDNTHPPPPRRDITYDLPSTKCLGTFRSMATATPPTAENRPLNPNVVFPPATPPSRAASDAAYPAVDDDGASPPKVLARFGFSPVGALRLVALSLAVALVVVEFGARTEYSGLADLFITLTLLQVIWLLLAFLTQGRRRQGSGGGGGGGGRKGSFTVDLGFVECVFGRRRRGDDACEGEGLLAWTKDDGSKRGRRVGMVYTAVDITFATISLVTGIVATSKPYCWGWGIHVGVAVVAIILGVVDGVIALAEQFAVMRRGRIQVVWDAGEEDDLGSHKYRIRLPQSPEQRHATMSVAA